LNSVSSPAIAKNAITVGASENPKNSGIDVSFTGLSMKAATLLGKDYIAEFSSRGPTADGRIKPDVVAPGMFISSAGAHPDNPGSCSVTSMMGTSMATPILSGVAALIRQYLREGFYPTGERNASNAITDPSSALIKAIILNGAQYMAGVDNGITHKVSKVYPYDNTQNFGRVSLVHSLYIKNMSEVQSFLLDRETISEGQTKTFTLKIDSSGGCINPKFSVTLVWLDLPGLPGCKKCLINDLDLSLQVGGKGITYFPNGLNTKDSKNNAERIIISQVQHGDSMKVFVKAADVDSFQNFSLVATGCFAGSGNQIMYTKNNVYDENDKSGDNRKWYFLLMTLLPVGSFILYKFLTKGKPKP